MAALELTDCRYEILFINDGSTDDSPAILNAMAERNPQVRVVHFSRNFGHPAAVQAGLDLARGDAIVVMDSDMQDDPRCLVDFVRKWREGYDVVYASANFSVPAAQRSLYSRSSHSEWYIDRGKAKSTSLRANDLPTGSARSATRVHCFVHPPLSRRPPGSCGFYPKPVGWGTFFPGSSCSTPPQAGQRVRDLCPVRHLSLKSHRIHRADLRNVRLSP